MRAGSGPGRQRVGPALHWAMSLSLLWADLLLELNKAPETYLHVDVVARETRAQRFQTLDQKSQPLKTSNSVTAVSASVRGTVLSINY